VALEFLRARGRATAPDAAKHFGLHRELMADRFASLERRGLVRRFKGASKALIWEAVE
jgi:predicted ArsR family transcriptional regulator